MKCINKILATILIIVFGILLVGCKRELPSAYNTFDTSRQYGLIKGGSNHDRLFAEDLCVTDGENLGVDDVSVVLGQAAGVFDIDTKETLFAQNVYEKIYPASTTKVLTAYLAYKYGKLDNEYTISETACDQEEHSSVCNLEPGDVLTLRQLTYGLLLRSGNDAAVAIAEAISGSVEDFAKLMNEEAIKLGATHSHFVNPNGLHDEDHYTCVYDMYLIFSAAMKYGEFSDMISIPQYKTVYKHANGESVSADWVNTNKYMNGQYSLPEGFTLIGGKTGTTGMAKYCLVILSVNPDSDSIISMVYHAESPDELYVYMTRILDQFASGR